MDLFEPGVVARRSKPDKGILPPRARHAQKSLIALRVGHFDERTVPTRTITFGTSGWNGVAKKLCRILAVRGDIPCT